MKHDPKHQDKKKVGAALSLSDFAKAKTSKYDKRKVVQKQLALKAKQLNKWRRKEKRLLAQQGAQGFSSATAFELTAEEEQQEQQQQRQLPHVHDQLQLEQQEQPDQQQQWPAQQRPHEVMADASDKPHHKQKHRNRAAEQAAALEQQQQQKEQQRRLMEQRAQQLKERQRQRSHEKHHFFQRTKKGQPVMKHRVDKILATLQKEAAGAAAAAGGRR